MKLHYVHQQLPLHSYLYRAISTQPSLQRVTFFTVQLLPICIAQCYRTPTQLNIRGGQGQQTMFHIKVWCACSGVPVLGYVLKHVHRHVLRHKLEHVPGHTLKHVPMHVPDRHVLDRHVPEHVLARHVLGLNKIGVHFF